LKLLSCYNRSTYSYLQNLITLQPPRSTRSSSVVTLSRLPTISSLKITDHSFRYASPGLWNLLPDSFRQPCLDLPPPLLNPFLLFPLSSSITPSLFHSRLKSYLFNKSFHLKTSLPTTAQSALPHDNGTGPEHAHHFISSFTFLVYSVR